MWIVEKFKKHFCNHEFEKQEGYGPVTIHKLDGTTETFHAVRIYECCTKCNKRIFVGYE